jgi:hypothetical protein
MKTTIISFTFLLFLIIPPTKAQEWVFVGLDSLLIKQLYASDDTIWAGTAHRVGNQNESGLYFSSDSGNNWVRLDSSLGNGSILDLEFLYGGSDTFYILKGELPYSSIGKLYKTTNLGIEWELNAYLENLKISSFAVSKFNLNEFYVIERIGFPAGILESLYKSSNGGEKWNEIGFFPASSHGRRVTFNFSLTDSNKLYAAVNDMLGTEYFYISTNKGNTWNYISEPPAVEQELITDPTIPNRIFMFPGYHLSEDDGYSWTVAASGLPDVSSYLSFYSYPRNKTIFYNLRKDGLYISNNYPIYWQLVEGSDSLPLNLGSQGFQYWDIGQLNNIFIDTLTNEIYVGTAKGIYKKNLITDVNEIIENKLLEYILYQNHPNPFNPTTIISFQIPENSFITLKVYDILGNEINTLVAEEKFYGRYQITFDGSELSSGVYFYVLTAITENGLRIREGKKMLLIK